MGSVLCGCLGGDCRSESKDKTDGGKGEHTSLVTIYFVYDKLSAI